MDNSLSEEELRNRFVEAYKHSRETMLYLEVPVFSRSVDLVIQDINDLSIMAVEFKIHDWKRAILQAQGVSLCFDFLSICLPRPKTMKGYQTIVDACEINGVGLYFYDTQNAVFDKILDSPKTKSIWDAQKKRVMGYLEAKLHERDASNTEV